VVVRWGLRGRLVERLGSGHERRSPLPLAMKHNPSPRYWKRPWEDTINELIALEIRVFYG